MSEIKNQQSIEAINFDAPNSEPQKQHSPINSDIAVGDKRPWWHSQFNLMLCVFGLLIISAGLFVLLTPSPDVNQSYRTSASLDQSTDDANGVATPSATEQETPFSESQKKQARADSQDILADLLASKKSLEQKKVDEWAPQKFQAALDLAKAGDELYGQQNYDQAIANYQKAFTDMEAIHELIPDILAGLINDGVSAIDAGKTELAKNTLSKALLLDSNSILALNAMGRANNLDQVLDLLRNAKQQEQIFATSDLLSDLKSAQSDYQAAAQLDDKNTRAIDGLKRVTELESDKLFRLEMTSGFNALFVNRYPAAKSAFSKALNIKPNDVTAKTAYQQSLAADKSSSLSGLIAAAKRFESNEQWASALSNYQAVLQRDPNQVSAKLGKIRSQARGELDQQLKEVLSDTLSLARVSQKEKALAVLNDAKAISKKGPRLNKQISAIEASLNNADVALKVSFLSDNLSDVSLKKEGARAISLGRFDRKNLSLKPGRYVISATRLGFRDERKEIELTPSSSGVLSFSIRCDQQVSSANSANSSSQKGV